MTARVLGRVAAGVQASLALALLAWMGNTLALALVLVLPLVLPLPGLWRGGARTGAASTLVMVFYTGGLLAEAYARPAHQASALLLATWSVLAFLLLIAFVRLQARQDRAKPVARKEA